MPDMVYSICKLAQEELSKREMQEAITLGDERDGTKSQFNTVFNFCVACEFIKEDINGIIVTVFNHAQLIDFRHYSYAVFSRVFQENNTFSHLAKWYLSQNVSNNPLKGESILNIRTESEFRSFLPKHIQIDENYFNGFRFWMTALGLTAFYSPGSSMSGVPFLFATHKAIRNWIEFAEPFQAGSYIPAERFFTKMAEDCPAFVDCIDFDHNRVSSSVSSGLRVLEHSNLISLERIADAGNLWHLTESIYFSISNEISDIVIKEIRNA